MRRHWAFLIGLLLVLIWAGLFLFHRFESQEVKTLDWRFQRRAAYQVARLDASELRDPDVVLVLITEDCIREHGRWPWDRGLVARLIEEVSEAGAQIIGVDIQYYESSNQRSDGAFQRALERAGNVVLASDIRTEWELDPISFDFRVNLQVNEPLLQFKRAAREMGLVSIDPYVENPDGILRKTPLGKYVQGRYLPSFALNVVSLYLDSPVLADPSGRVLLGTYEVPTVPGKLVAIDEERKNSKPHPLGFEQCIWINYPPVGPEAEFFRRIPARDILAGNSTEDLKGKIVLIGVSALGAERDNKLTVQGLMSGVEFLANIVRNLKNRNALVRLPPAWSVASILILGFLTALVFAWTSLAWSFFAMVSVMALVICSSLFAFIQYEVVLEIVPAVSLAAALFVVEKLFLLATELAQRLHDLQKLKRASREFNAVLDLEQITSRVLGTTLEESLAEGAILAIVRNDSDELTVTSAGRIPDRLVSLLHHKRIVYELCHIWEKEPQALLGPQFAIRPAVAPDQVELFLNTVFFPAFLKDQVQGFLVLKGEGFERKHWEEEGAFWTTLASMARAAIENGILYRLATVDGLTTLFVRHFFDIEIEKTFGRAIRYQENLAFLMTDIDHFKKINDTYGHQSGDRVLRMVAQEIKRLVRLSDVACRYGGEEFSVILPATDREGAMQLAERIRTRIAQLEIPTAEGEVRVTLSIGLAFTPGSRAQTASDFIEEADAALYHAKRTGRNRVVAFRDGLSGETMV